MTTASPGDIKFNTFTIQTAKGSLNLNDPNKAKKLEFNVYYDILSPVVAADVEILDENDALGTYNIKGGEDVQINFTVPGGELVSLKMKTFENADLNDNTIENKGAGKHKTYTIKLVSPELNNNRGKHFQDDFGGSIPTSDIVSKAIKKISDKQVDTPDATTPQVQHMLKETVFGFLEKIRNVHVSQQYKSSAYILFPTYDSGTEKYKFCTFEYLMAQGSKFDFKQDSTVGTRTTTDGNQMHNILWVNVPSSFNSAEIAGSATGISNYNIQTGKQLVSSKTMPTFVTLGTDPYKTLASQYDNVPKEQRPPRGATGEKNGTISPSIDKNKTNLAQAAAYRSRFLSYLAQNTIKFEVHGNPNIKIGDVVTLKLPKKADAGQDSGETQMNDKVLIVKIRHRVLPEGNKPRYTMIIEAVKAAFKEG
jgi:hypothetical protein